MPRAAFGFASLVAALTVALTGLAASPSAASAAGETGQQAIHNAIDAQLMQKPGGTVRGNSIVYAAEGVTVKYIPRTAQGTRVVVDAGGLCDPENLCLYANTYWGTQVLETSSLWCPREGYWVKVCVYSDDLDPSYTG